ncbi:Ig-like domain repeat protein [Methanobrevibacter gottschalkii]|uniref:Ig-like domain repeat protein n=1 Tax=Methanobrevibacter gottschalkii TaxID=190974 RepID=UPI0038D114D3
MSYTKFILILSIIFLLFASIAFVSAADTNTSIVEEPMDVKHNLCDINNSLENQEIYVSPLGDDDANGSFQNPVSSIHHAVAMAKNNSKVILMEGEYKGANNTFILINKNLTIESFSNNVVINGENKHAFFKITPSSSLILNNIKFINGYTDSYSQLGIINNLGTLVINNSSFNNMNSIMGTFFNEGTLKIENTKVTNAVSLTMAQILTNIGNTTILNSQLIENNEYSSIDVVVYNYNRISIVNSQVNNLFSNKKYSEDSYNLASILINNSKLDNIDLEDAFVCIHNSQITFKSIFNGCNVSVDESTFLYNKSLFSIINVMNSNFTAIHSVFNSPISTKRSHVNITYSAILRSISGNAYKCYLYAPYNWWGINSGPSYQYFTDVNVSYWAISTFEYESDYIPINPNSTFTTTLNKWSDGNSTFEFKTEEYLPFRHLKFESQNGKFLYSSANIEKVFSNYLIGNNLDCQVHVIIDFQRLTLRIGEGLTNYNYFVSTEGHDGLGNGTFEHPFKTINYAVSKVGNGNTICLLEGIYKGNWNSNVTITKNITIVGLGNVNLLRSNDYSIFNIKEWGSLSLKNINFSVDIIDYAHPLIILNGGNLSIINCSFSNITSTNVIHTSNGIEHNGIVNISDSYFADISGSILIGSAKVSVSNSLFEKIKCYRIIQGYEYYNVLFAISSSIEIYSSCFQNNLMGIVNLHPFFYSSSKLRYSQYSNAYSRYAYIKNTKFENNVFFDKNSYYSSNGIGLDIYNENEHFYGIIDNCSFINNKGQLAIATSVNSSIFMNNFESRYGYSMVYADLINNSVFINNKNLYEDYNNVFIGNGIASAGCILESIFMYNEAAFGGAIADTKEAHYCVFVNNTSKYGGNDIYSYSGDVDYSSNWWGDNQKPNSDKVFIFLGTLTLNNWVIMTFESVSNSIIKASLNALNNGEGNICKINHNMPSRMVYFKIDHGSLSPENTLLINNSAYTNMTYDLNLDFKVYARIDNQLLELDIRNTKTLLIMEDVIFKGKSNNFAVDLININGYKIFNQTLVVEIIDENNTQNIFTIQTDDNGHAEFNVDYPVGIYQVNINYLGNGYFDKCNSTSIMKIIKSNTYLISYNQTYYGKNNLFKSVLFGEGNKKLSNMTIKFTIIDSKDNLREIYSLTNQDATSEIIINLDVGEYTIRSEFLGDLWYSYSSSISHILVNPVSSTLIVSNVTLYGVGDVYNITLKDIHGSLIRGENIIVTITQGASCDKFTLKTDNNGVAKLTINYLPGVYNVKAQFLGDSIYAPTSGEGVIKVEKIFTIISGFHHCILPLNGIYTVVLSDMYGRRVNNESVTLSLYKGNLIKKYTINTDANGEADFVINLEEGTYLTTFEYGGNKWYCDATNAATIVVSKKVTLSNININSTDLVQYYGENKYFIIKFNDPNAYSQYGKKIVVTISSGSWSQSYEVFTDIFGLARLKINLNPGEYNITYKYSNSHYNIFGTSSNTIHVYKMPAVLIANNIVMKSNEQQLYEINLRDINNNPIKNMLVNIDIDGVKYNSTTNDEGIAKILLSLGVGKHIISYNFTNPNYLSSNSSSVILVVDSDKIPSNLYSQDINAFDNQILNFTIRLSDMLNNSISSSEVILELFTFYGESIINITGITDSNGRISFDLNLDYGKYIANLHYNGNALYLASYSTNTINIESADNRTKTILFNVETKLTNSKYYVILSDINGTLLVNKEIKFIIGNKTITSITDEKGRAYLELNLNPNYYIIKAIFNGDKDYKSVSSLKKIFISGELTHLYAIPLVKYYRNGTQFHARLVNSKGVPLINKILSILLEGNYYNCTTDENGWITLNIDLKPGFYDVECYYYSNNTDENSFDKTNITVLSTVLGQSEVKYYGDYPYLTIKFLDGAGNLIKNTSFVIDIDGKKYSAQTNDEGIFNFNLNLNSGSHLISVNNPYDGLFVMYKLDILTTICSNNLVKVFNNGVSYTAQLLDSFGNPLKNKNVKIIINGVLYYKKTDVKGILELNMDFNPKIYLVTVFNPVTKEYIENTVKILPTLINNKNINMYFSNCAFYKVRAIGSDGKIVESGVIVKIKVNGKSYKIKTNKDGYALFKINLKPGKYIITAEYNSYIVSNKINVKSLLTAKNIFHKKAKKIKFSSKLVDIKGKALKGKKITFKFKGKVYKVKTNKNGIATLTIKNLKVGKYTIMSIWNKFRIKNTIKIKK